MEKRDIVTGTPAGFWVRVGAQALDAIVLGVYFLFLSMLTLPFLPRLTAAHGRQPVIILVISILYLAIPCLYFTLATVVWGQTFGKKVFNLWVTDRDGQPLSYGRSLWRWLSYFFSLIPLGLGFVLAGIHPEKRSLHDLISETKVVQVGTAKQTLVILVLLGMPFASLPFTGILAAIAIPRFAQMLEKSREGTTKVNLGSLKAAVSIYKKDHGGKPPKNLEKDLVPKYLDKFPPVKVTGAFVAKSKSPAGNNVTLAKPGKVPTVSGSGWLYDPSRGKIYVNSTVKDSKGIPYSFYGFE
jgi:uncharacterized RDD family membrane protein YckC/type II secretory pathway pseudopilin PulG